MNSTEYQKAVDDLLKRRCSCMGCHDAAGKLWLVGEHLLEGTPKRQVARRRRIRRNITRAWRKHVRSL